MIVGDGAAVREIEDLVVAVNAVATVWEVVAGDPADPAVLVVVAGGPFPGSVARARVVRRLAVPTERLATLVHPSAVVASTARLGAGVVVHPLAVVGAGAVVGPHARVGAGAIVGADGVVDGLVHVGVGVRLGTAAVVELGASLDTGVLVADGVHIGPWAMVGTGAVVVRPVPGGEVWAGSPAARTGLAPVPDPVSLEAVPGRRRRVGIPIALGPAEPRGGAA